MSMMTFALMLALAPPLSHEALDAEGIVTIEAELVDLPQRDQLPESVALELRNKLAGESSLPAGAVLAPDRKIRVELLPGPFPDGGDVLIRCEAFVDGRLVAESAREICVACSDADVAVLAFPLVQSLLPFLPEPERETAALPSSAAPASGELDVAPSGPRRPRRPLLIAGSTSLVVGAAALAAGLTMIVVDERTVSEPGAAQLEILKLREPGIAVAVGGGVAMLTGAILVGLAFRDDARRVAVTPVWTPTQAGLGVVGRF